MSNRNKILLNVRNLASDFLYLFRKEDKDLGIGEIEESINNEEVSLDDLVEEFRKGLEDHGL